MLLHFKKNKFNLIFISKRINITSNQSFSEETNDFPFIKQVVAIMNSLVVSFDKYLKALISACVQPPMKKTRVIF